MKRGFISALCFSAVFALLAACGALRQPGDTPPIVAPGAMKQSGPIAQHETRSKSWMLPAAKGRDLLYISKPFYPGARDVYVYTFPGAKQIGMLGGLGQPEGECVDKTGNVFIIDVSDSNIYEYAHGGTNPIAILQSPYVGPVGCSVDPLSEKLAVSGRGSSGTVSIFAYKPKRGWRFPKTYSVAGMSEGAFCGYDDKGNLYLDGTSPSRTFKLVELPKNAASFVGVTLNKNIGAPGPVQWDGKHLAIGDSGLSPLTISEFAMSGSSGTKVGSTTLGGTKEVGQFWIQGHWVVGSDFYYSGVGAGFWPYPAGGDSKKTIDLYEPYGAVVSLAK